MIEIGDIFKNLNISTNMYKTNKLSLVSALLLHHNITKLTIANY